MAWLRRLAWIAAPVAVAAGIAILLRRAPAPPAAAPLAPAAASRRSLAVVGFENHSRRPEAEWIATALQEALAAGLGAGGSLRTLSGDEVARARAELGPRPDAGLTPADLIQLGRRLGVDLLVLGSYTVEGDAAQAAIQLDLSLQDAATGKVIHHVAESGTVAALVDLVVRCERSLRDRLGVARPADDETGARAALPQNPEAARLYAEGLARLRVFDALAARSLLDKAAELDPQDPMIHLALAETWSTLGYDARAKNETRRAFELSAGLPLEQRLSIEAKHREVVGERERAEELYRTLSGFYPDNIEYGRRLAGAQAAAGQRSEALATLGLLRRKPHSPVEDAILDLEEATVRNALGDYKGGQAAAARASEKGQAVGARLLTARAHLVEGYSYRALGDAVKAVHADQAARALFEAAGDRRGTIGALLEMAALLRYQGDMEESRAMATGALALAKQIGDRSDMTRAMGRIATILAEQGHLAESQAMHQETVELWREIGDKSSEGTSLNNVGETLWKRGELKPARANMEQAVALFRRSGSKRGLCFATFNLGFVLLDQGELLAARGSFEESLDTGRAIAERSLTAVALHGLGRTLLTQGDTVLARRRLEEALALRKELGEKGRTAETALVLATLSLKEGRAAEAEVAARGGVAEFHLEKSADNEALARSILAEILLARGEVAEGLEAVRAARTLSERSECRTVRLAVAIAAARARAASSHPADAVKDLKPALAEARDSGLVAFELEARLALGEIELRFGDPQAAAVALEDLAAEAARRGYGFLAARAAALKRGARPPRAS